MRKRNSKKPQTNGQVDSQTSNQTVPATALNTRDAGDLREAAPIEASETRSAIDSPLVGQRAHYLEELLATTSDAIITLGQDFRIHDLNQAAAAALGCPRADAPGRSCMKVLRCQNMNHMELCGTSSCPLTRALEKQQPLPHEELVIGTLPDHLHEVSTSVTPLTMDGACYVTFMARDLSALKVANYVRSNFVSMVSHELRTPLNSVHGFVDLLLQGHMGALNEEQRKYLGYAQEGVQQLISIVEDILFMTRSDLGQFEMKMQEVQFRSLIKQVIRSLHPQALKAGVVLCDDIELNAPSLYADPQRIKQVLNNLVTNAIKFTPPAGTVTVSSRRFDEQFQMISVTDTGYGIPADDCPHIFERFYQSNHSQQSKMGGYGLGLPIARLIVEQHGGTIGFDTTLDKGTTFYFTLPLYQGQPS